MRTRPLSKQSLVCVAVVFTFPLLFFSSGTLRSFTCVGYDDDLMTSSPDYDYVDNVTLHYSFFSNTSSEDLDRFLKDGNPLLDSQEDQDRDRDRDQDWDEDEAGVVTTATQRERAGRGGVTTAGNASSSTFACCSGVTMMMMMMMMMTMVVMETHT
ncbi:uncharacterized protein LOC144007005 isoform X1 [Festucalex cinctus]